MTSPAFIDLTHDEPDDGSHVTVGERAYSRELEILRAQNRELEHENSTLKLHLKETQNELKFTRESLGKAIVAAAMQTTPTEPSSTSLKRPRSPPQEPLNVLHSSQGEGDVKAKVEECEVKLDPCKVEEKTPFEDIMGSQSESPTVSHERSKRRRIDVSNAQNGSSRMDTSPVAEGIPTPSPSLTLSASKEPKKTPRSAVVSRGNKKSEESEDFIASVKSYLKSARTLKIHPPPLDTRIKRVPFAGHYGGCSQHFLQYISPLKNPSGPVKRKMVFPQPDMNPTVPSSPGEPGLIFASRHEILEDPPWTLFVKCIPKMTVWTYMGEYESVICGRLEAEKFRALSDKVKNKWGEFLLEQQRDVYLSMRVRIALRKAGVIPMEDKKKEEECIAKEKRAVKSSKKNLGKYAVSDEDVIKAFSDGDEWIDIIRMTCTSYDHVFARDIQQRFNNPTAATPGSSASRTTTPNLVQNRTRRSSNFATYLVDTDEDEWMDDEENSEDDFVGPSGLGESHLRRSSRKRQATHIVLDEDDDMYGFH